jgi:hypothetical protein
MPMQQSCLFNSLNVTSCLSPLFRLLLMACCFTHFWPVSTTAHSYDHCVVYLLCSDCSQFLCVLVLCVLVCSLMIIDVLMDCYDSNRTVNSNRLIFCKWQKPASDSNLVCLVALWCTYYTVTLCLLTSTPFGFSRFLLSRINQIKCLKVEICCLFNMLPPLFFMHIWSFSHTGYLKLGTDLGHI